MVMVNRQLQVQQMVCVGCEDIINQTAKALPGVVSVKAEFVSGCVAIGYDDSQIDLLEIIKAIEAKGYPVTAEAQKGSGIVTKIAVFILLFMVVGGVALWGKTLMPQIMPLITSNMEDSLLIGVGFLTGFHCIGMCGGFIVAYTNPQHSKWRQLWAHLSYGFGKTFSYSLLGAGFGLLGASIAITPHIRGIAALTASVFLVVYGLKMLGIFAILRRFTLRLPSAATGKINSSLRKHRSPLMTGLLTGLLLGCGPLQAMYVMAAGSGDPLQGAKILFLFGIGTLAPLLGFGMFASVLSANAMHQLVRVSGILVIAMGLMMANRGLSFLNPAGHTSHAKGCQAIPPPSTFCPSDQDKS